MLKTHSQESVESELISTRLTQEEAKQVDRLVHFGMFLNRSDFLRMAAREKLQQVRVIELRDVNAAQARKEILAYIRENPNSYPSDIATALELDLDLVMRICRELIEGNRLEEVEAK